MLAGIIHIEIESASIIKLSVLHAIPAVRLDVRIGSVMFDMARCMARQLCGVILVSYILMSSDHPTSSPSVSESGLFRV